jgi:hypothetical protein
MSVRFWGVRGSIPCPGPDTVGYGGNTSCVEIRCGDQVLIFDAGTGIRPLGKALMAEGKVADTDIFLSHRYLLKSLPHRSSDWVAILHAAARGGLPHSHLGW